MVSLVRAVHRDVKVSRLLRAEGGQLDVELLEMSTGNLLVEFLGKDVYTEGELLGCRPESDLSENLVGERT